jgi:hypothetical protein
MKDKATITFCRAASGEVTGEIITEKGGDRLFEEFRYNDRRGILASAEANGAGVSGYRGN